MNFPFRRDRHITVERTPMYPSKHHMESAFETGLCRFVLTCTCGAQFDTPFIDEALELRELHEALAPLSDQLPR